MVIEYRKFEEKREETRGLTFKEMFEKMYPGKTPEEVLDEQKDRWREEQEERTMELDPELGALAKQINEIEPMAIDADLKEMAESVGVKTPDLPFEDARNRMIRKQYNQLTEKFENRLQKVKRGEA